GKIVFYDSETTGLDADKCELIRVVAEKYNVEYSSDSNTYILSDREDIDIFIRPAVPMSADVENITGITNEMLTDKPNEKEAFEAIKAVFCDADLIVGHSTKFELPFFKAMFERCGSSFAISKPIDDTYLLAKALIPKHKIKWHYSLRNVSAYFGAGKADNDAAKVRKVYIGLAGIAGVYLATT
ncbi:MAG: 3'-5' exonuclease, partial [Ruminiclostridium sp.]|nr:3'-5' exonuclease [Ruminiclostridium sp.]